MEGAYMKYVSTMEIGNRRQVFTVPFFAVGLTSLFLSGLLIFRSPLVADWIHVPAPLAGIVAQGALILFLDALTLIPFASLRMASQARTFAFIKVAGILVNVLCNVLFLFVFKAGVEGIFLSNIISAVVVLILLLPTIVRGLAFFVARRTPGSSAAVRSPLGPCRDRGDHDPGDQSSHSGIP